MSYPLKPVLRLRTIREEKAARDLARRKEAVQTADQALETCRRRAADYRDDRCRREAEAYDAIQGRMVGVDDMDHIRAVIRFERDLEVQLDSAVQQAAKRVEQERAAMEKTAKAWRAAVFAKKKIETHEEAWSAEHAVEMERALEREQEDRRVMRPVRFT